MIDDPDDARPPMPVPTLRARAAARIRGLAIDLSPLRVSRDYRLLWIGEMVSHTGRHISVVALPYQIFVLTDSTLAVGMLGLVQFVPLIIFSIIGGAIADAMDRRRLLAWTQVGLTAGSLMLVGGAIAGDPPLWFLYLTAGIIAALSGLDAPARTAAIPGLVPKGKLAAAIALNFGVFQASDVIGPAVGGLIIARAGLAWAYGIDAFTFLVALYTVWRMRPMPPQHEGQEPARGFRSVREGFAYLRGRRVLQSTFWIDLNAMVFGMPRAVFPALALVHFRVGPAGLGLLYAAPAAGAVLGLLSSGWVNRVRRQGRAVLWAVAAWGAAIAVFGITPFWLGLILLAVAGWADIVSAVLRSTILQQTVPDRLRGRLSSIHFAVVVGGPRLGDVEAGVVAHLFTPTISVISGGLACIAGAGVIALLIPQLARYHAGEEA
ncbi:MAG TPA: MFS transporter [Actinomycetota bacterium]|nr:MFS transporter [Actinomycetota bacterium]